MTSVAVIMAQLGALVPASQATFVTSRSYGCVAEKALYRIAPIDKIQTRMGAYDNMFSNSSTFKVELDEVRQLYLPSNTSLILL